MLYTKSIFNRYKFFYFVASMALLVFSAFHYHPAQAPTFEEITRQEPLPPDSLELRKAGIPALEPRDTPPPVALSDSLVLFALELLGTPYRYGGTSPKGFDCSGFVYHVYKQFGLELSRSSKTQSREGSPVALEAVQKGDLLFFTGTNPQRRTVGHVGMVISDPDETLQFVHASSNGGVKVSELAGYYQTRFMLARRIPGSD